MVKVSPKHGCGEIVGGARWRTIDTGEGGGVWNGFVGHLGMFKGRMRERKRLWERQKWLQGVFVEDSNAAGARRAGEWFKLVSTWSETLYDWFITFFVQPCLGQKCNVNMFIEDKIGNNRGLIVLTHRSTVEKTDFQFVRKTDRMKHDR